MLTNFKGKQNTNGFAQNKNNINRKGRPIDTLSLITKEAIRSGDFGAGIEETMQYIKKTNCMERNTKKHTAIDQKLFN